MPPRKKSRSAAANEAICRRLRERTFRLCASLDWAPDPDWSTNKPLAFRPFGPGDPPMLATAAVLSDPDGKAAPISYLLVALAGGIISTELVQTHDQEIQRICRRYCVSLTVGDLVPPSAGGERIAKANLSVVVLEQALTAASLLEATKLIHMAQMDLADLCRQNGVS